MLARRRGRRARVEAYHVNHVRDQRAALTASEAELDAEWNAHAVEWNADEPRRWPHPLRVGADRPADAIRGQPPHGVPAVVSRLDERLQPLAAQSRHDGIVKLLAFVALDEEKGNAGELARLDAAPRGQRVIACEQRRIE